MAVTGAQTSGRNGSAKFIRRWNTGVSATRKNMPVKKIILCAPIYPLPNVNIPFPLARQWCRPLT